MCFLLCFHLVQGLRFRALVVASPPFFIAAFFYCRLFLLGDARKWYFSHGLLVAPTIRGKESAHMRGVRSFGSVPTCSGWCFSHIGRFRPLRMTIRGERMGSYLGDTLHVLELSVLYTIRVGLWRRGAPKAQDGSTKRCERLCEITRLPPVIPIEVEGSFLQSGKS